MIQKYCSDCGSLLEERKLEGEGIVPFCPHCEAWRFPMYNMAVSMIVINRANDRILLIQQYGKKRNILVAGYVNRGESAEAAALREIREETGMTATELHFNRTRFYEPSNTLMMNFTAYVEDDSELCPNREIDSLAWYTPKEAREAIAPGSLAAEFLCTYLDQNDL